MECKNKTLCGHQHTTNHNKIQKVENLFMNFIIKFKLKQK